MTIKISILIVMILLFTVALSACPTCYGVSDSPVRAGMDKAILTMLGITGFVLMLIVASFIRVWRKTRKLREDISEKSFIDQQGIIHSNNDKGVVEWNNF
ncbi:MAG TPA: hypothetical protein VFF29_03640 [Bacteroidota bacterium]|nr:hypothetical protein [Bacteroidota bacterium]